MSSTFTFYIHIGLLVLSVYVFVYYYTYYALQNQTDTFLISENTNGTDTFVSNGKHVHLLKQSMTTEKTQILSRLVRDMNTVVEWCISHKYPNEEDAFRLKKNWSQVDIHETTFRDHVAYVVDKNKDFKLCVTSPTGEYENENTMRFVVLHELAHMMSESYGHNTEFYNHFVNLLRVAVFLKLYTPEPFSSHPVSYCGTTVSSSPCETVSCTTL